MFLIISFVLWAFSFNEQWKQGQGVSETFKENGWNFGIFCFDNFMNNQVCLSTEINLSYDMCIYDSKIPINFKYCLFMNFKYYTSYL